MKLSTCISAWILGLASVVTTTALGAPPDPADPRGGETGERDPQGAAPADAAGGAGAERAPKNEQEPAAPSTAAADAAPAAQEGQSAATAASPSAAPAAGSVTPTVSFGGPAPAPGSDAPAESPPEPSAKSKPRPFAGSALYTQNSITTGTVFRGQQLDYNPTIESSLWLLPRYAINDAFQLRARTIINYEYTNSDTTTYRNEPMVSDTTLQLYYRKIPQLPLGIIPAVALNMGLPTSKLSRARTQVVAPGATLQLLRPFEHVLGGEAALLFIGSYSHPLYQSRTAEVVDPRPAGAFQCMGGNGCQDLLSGTMNPSDILSYALLFEIEWGKWNPAVYYLGATQWAYSPKDVINPIDGTPVGRPAGFEPTTVRQTHYFSAWLDYNFNSWFTGEIGFWNSTSALNGAGERSNPFFNRYADTRVYLGASFQLDNLVKALQGGEEGEAGVVRAKNRKQPMWTF